MQVKQVVVTRIEVNVMDNLTLLRTGQFSVLPLPSRPGASVTVSTRIKRFAMVTVRLLNGSPGGLCGWHLGHRADHLVTAPHMSAVRRIVCLLTVCVKRVSMSSKHLVMAHAEVASCGRPLTQTAGSADDLATPPVIRGSVPLDALVVHQAVTVGGVLPVTAIDAAFPVKPMSYQRFLHNNGLPNIRHREVSVNVMDHIGQRIALVDSIRRAA